jgi:hypothetical protein
MTSNANNNESRPDANASAFQAGYPRVSNWSTTVKKTTAAMVVATALLCTSVFPGDSRAQGVSASDKMSPEQAREENDTHASSRLATTVQHQPHNQGGVGVVCKKKNNKPNLASDAPGFRSLARRTLPFPRPDADLAGTLRQGPAPLVPVANQIRPYW